MAQIDYHRASVLVFDPVHVNLRTTRYALHEIGFRKIESVSTLKDFERQLSEFHFDLVIAESAAPGVDVLPMVRALRRGEVGKNPFLVILLTSWVRDGGHIRRSIESGADDVIVRPFSTAFAEERVRALVRERKAFVVTSDYVGPDRRSDAARKSDASALRVPNTLNATVQGDQVELAKAFAWIDEAKKTVESERIRRLAMRIVVTAELQITGGGADRLNVDISDMARTARDLKRQLDNVDRVEASEVAAALIDHVAGFKAPEARVEKNYRLAKELAIGAYAAYANGASIERSKDEISRTVTTLRKRIQSRTEEDGGAEAEPELKTAAM